MGGAFGTIEAYSLAEILKKVHDFINYAQELGLVELRACILEFDADKGKYCAHLWVHS